MTEQTLEQRKAELRQARAALVLRRGADYMASPEQRIRNRIEAVKAQAFVDPEANVKDELKDLYSRLHDMGAKGGRERKSRSRNSTVRVIGAGHQLAGAGFMIATAPAATDAASSSGSQFVPRR